MTSYNEMVFDFIVLGFVKTEISKCEVYLFLFVAFVDIEIKQHISVLVFVGYMKKQDNMEKYDIWVGKS